uniref:VP4 n=1 Tax=Rotavirus I TaxID=1637496 RepID=A0A1S6XXJ7_9REOV|nr:VP4 [Rotavirus I]
MFRSLLVEELQMQTNVTSTPLATDTPQARLYNGQNFDENGERHICYRDTRSVDLVFSRSAYPIKSMDANVDEFGNYTFYRKITVDSNNSVSDNTFFRNYMTELLNKNLYAVVKVTVLSTGTIDFSYQGQYAQQYTCTYVSTAGSQNDGQSINSYTAQPTSGGGSGLYCSFDRQLTDSQSRSNPAAGVVTYLLSECVTELTSTAQIEIEIGSIDLHDGTSILLTRHAGCFMKFNATTSARQRKINTSTHIYRHNIPVQQVISQKVEGFWKIVSEVFTIQIRTRISCYGAMGGPFRNWLTINGFKQEELTYDYERNGKTITATTLTTLYPTGKTGIVKPSAAATDFNGHAMAMVPGDILEIRYTENAWSLANSIYAKDFSSDSQHEFCIPDNPSNNMPGFQFYMNYVSGLNHINNSSGKSCFAYSSGGFSQVDLKSYTGIAIVIRFKVKDLPTHNPMQIPNDERKIWQYYSNIGHYGTNKEFEGSGHIRKMNGSQPGFQACYEPIEHQFDMRVAYTALAPSDPAFTTGGGEFKSSVNDDLFNMTLGLQQQINDLSAELNVQQVTSGLFEALSNIYQLPSVVSGFMSTFKKIRGFITSLPARRNAMLRTRNRTLINRKYNLANATSTNVPYKSLTDDQMLTMMNYVVSQDTALQPVVAATILESTPLFHLPVTTQISSRIAKFNGIKPSVGDVLEINIPAKQISIMNSKTNIITLPFDPEVVDDILSKMSVGHSRSLFSLQMRKHILSGRDIRLTLDDIMNDYQLIDITKHLTTEKQKQFFAQFIELYKQAMTV